MAAIPQYTSDLASKGVSITGSGAAATAQAAANDLATGQHVDAAMRQAGQEFGSGVKAAGETGGEVYDKLVTQPDISKLTLATANTLDDLTIKYNQAMASSNPNNAAATIKDFREKVLEPQLQALHDAAETNGGKDFALQQVQSMRSHFFEKSTADLSTQAGMAVQQNLIKSNNVLTNVARRDPSSIFHVLDQIDKGTDQVVANAVNLTPQASAQLRTTIKQQQMKEAAEAAILGAAEQGGAAAADRLMASGKLDQYIDGPKMQQMIVGIDRAKRYDHAIQTQEQQKVSQETANKAMDEYTQQIYDPKQKAPSLQQIATDPRFEGHPAQRQQMINIVKRELQPETAAAASAGEAQKMFEKIVAPASDPDKITDIGAINRAYSEGKLSRNDFAWLRNEFTVARDPNGATLQSQAGQFIQSVKQSISKSNPLQGVNDPSGDQQMYAFTQALNAKINQYRQAGKDPYSLITPGSPDYMGTPERLAPFQVPLDQSIKNTAARVGPRGNLTDEAATGKIISIETTNIPPADPKIEALVKSKYPDAEQDHMGRWVITREHGKYFIDPSKLGAPMAPSSQFMSGGVQGGTGDPTFGEGSWASMRHNTADVEDRRNETHVDNPDDKHATERQPGEGHVEPNPADLNNPLSKAAGVETLEKNAKPPTPAEMMFLQDHPTDANLERFEEKYGTDWTQRAMKFKRRPNQMTPAERKAAGV